MYLDEKQRKEELCVTHVESEASGWKGETE